MSVYEEVEIEDLDYDPVTRIYTYPCPCGDHFRISLEDLWDGEDIAPCPSCTLRIMIIYDEEDLPPLPDDEDTDDSEEEGEDNDKDRKEIENEEENNDIKTEEELIQSVQTSLLVH
jgi:diphthamide biosynthesis protein 3